jgi:hypothetical protein
VVKDHDDDREGAEKIEAGLAFTRGEARVDSELSTASLRPEGRFRRQRSAIRGQRSELESRKWKIERRKWNGEDAEMGPRRIDGEAGEGSR